MSATLSARIGGARYRLPDGVVLLDAPPAIRPLPGAGHPMLGLAAYQGDLLPVVAHDAPDGLQWCRLPPPASVLLGATRLEAADAADPPLPLSLLAPGLAPPPPPVIPAGRDRAASPAAAQASGAPLVLRLVPRRGRTIDLPAARVLRMVRATALPPAPACPPGALGYANTEVGDALVLDRTPFGAEDGADAAVLVVFALDGHRLALPCQAVGQGDAAGAAESEAVLQGEALRRLLPHAPRIVKLPAPPATPMRQVLVAIAGGLRFGLPAEAVATLIAPQRATPPPPGAPPAVLGLCAHRGDVLPVLDAAERLGGAPAAADALRPLIRLSQAPVALAIDGVPSLHHLPEADFTPLAPDGPLESVTRLDGEPLLICRAEALAAAAARQGGGP